MNINLLHPDDAADLQGDGFRDEFQRCHYQSGVELRASRAEAQVGEQIGRLLAAGRHVAVAYHPAYCRVTDACIGEHRSVLLHAPSRAALDAALAARFAENDSELDDGRIVILPAAPAEVAAAIHALPDDGVPF